MMMMMTTVASVSDNRLFLLFSFFLGWLIVYFHSVRLMSFRTKGFFASIVSSADSKTSKGPKKNHRLMPEEIHPSSLSGWLSENHEIAYTFHRSR